MDKRIIQLGFCGFGEWARKKYLPLLLENSNVSIVGISNILTNDEKNFLLTQIPDVIFFNDLDEMLQKQDIDGLVISLPHTLHYPACLTAINHRIPVLIDKPFTTNLLEAESLISEANNHNVQIGVSSQRRSQQGNKRIKELISAKAFGDQLDILGEFSHTSSPNWAQSWRNNPQLAGSDSNGRGKGLLLDTGYHLIDTICYVLFPLKPISVFASLENHGFQVETSGIVNITFEKDITTTVTFNRHMAENSSLERIMVKGNEGIAVAQRLEYSGVKTSNSLFIKTDEIAKIESISNDFSSEPIVDFISFLSGDDQNFVNIWSAKNSLTTMQVIDAAYKSHYTQRIVEI